MVKKKLIIASRKSPLARFQAELVMSQLTAHHPDLLCEWRGITTTGDVNLTQPLSEMGGKALFLKEIQTALLSGEADIAVHSLKDVPPDNPPELHLSAFLTREDPRDVLIAPHLDPFPFSKGGLGRDFIHKLPPNARIGTSSLRRQTQLHRLRPDLTFLPLRGNIETRLSRVKKGEYDAIVLAAASLKRLNFTDQITAILSPTECLPAIGQGVIVCESRRADNHITELLRPLNDANTALCVSAERALQAALSGNCQVPIGGYACLQEEQLWIRAFLASPDLSLFLKEELFVQGLSLESAAFGGRTLGELLLRKRP